MTIKPAPSRLVEWFIGIPFLVLFALALLVVVPVFLLCRGFLRTVCPRCRLPFAKRVLSTTLDRPNIKFNIDHYRVACECRWCGRVWGYEKLG